MSNSVLVTQEGYSHCGRSLKTGLVLWFRARMISYEMTRVHCPCLASAWQHRNTHTHTHNLTRMHKHIHITAIHATFKLLPWKPVSIPQGILYRTVNINTNTHDMLTQWSAHKGPNALISWERTLCLVYERFCAKRYIPRLLRKKIMARSHDSLCFCYTMHHLVVTELYHSMIMVAFLPFPSSKVNYRFIMLYSFYMQQRFYNIFFLMGWNSLRDCI